MHEVIPFQFNGQDIPAIRDDDGQPWWKAADVCQQCEIKNVSKACERLDADEKAVITLSDSAGRSQDMLIVNEAGLYTLVLSSRKNAAKTFKRWVTHDVIPQIRKTGRYELIRPQVKDPAIQMLIDMAVHLDTVRAEAAEAKGLATRALEGQQWLTIRQYTLIYDLAHQFPASLQTDYGLTTGGGSRGTVLSMAFPSTRPRQLIAPGPRRTRIMRGQSARRSPAGSSGAVDKQSCASSLLLLTHP
mgnify:CR=1 FL=1